MERLYSVFDDMTKLYRKANSRVYQNGMKSGYRKLKLEIACSFDDSIYRTNP
jgi:hypothetical protein